MAGDDDDTDRLWRNPRRGQSANDRDLAARRVRTSPIGVPIAPTPRSSRTDPDVTSPFDMFEREPDDEARAIVQRSRRNSGDPATVDDLAKVLVAFYKEKSASREREREAEQVLEGPHKAHRATRRNLIAAVIAAGTSIAAAITGAATAGRRVEPPPSEERIQLQRELDRIELRFDTELREIRTQLGRHSRLELERSPAGDSLAAKGSVP